MQSATQTSPENDTDIPPASVQVKGHFSIGTVGKEERVSPKMNRKDRSATKGRSKRAISPAKMQQLLSTSKVSYSASDPVKEAMSPSVAESLRAVFAAFLWHEGNTILFILLTREKIVVQFKQEEIRKCG